MPEKPGLPKTSRSVRSASGLVLVGSNVGTAVERALGVTTASKWQSILQSGSSLRSDNTSIFARACS